MSAPETVSLRSLFRWQVTLLLGFTFLTAMALVFIHLLAPGAVLGFSFSFIENLFDAGFFFYLAAGFAAQLIDGALGMAYGVSSTSLLLSAGVPPAIASASVHVAEVFTTGASGLSHWRFGNIRKDLFLKLALPGAAGAALGAFVLTSFPGEVIKPYVAGYLVIMGVIIFLKAFRQGMVPRRLKHIRPLALVGGFVDASGGGGWGPVVTSTLIGTGYRPRVTIGTVNAAEFLIAVTASGVFSLFVGLSGWPVVLGLILGGVLAAPLGAYVCHKINSRTCLALVGLLVIFLSVRTLVLSFS
jgi:uncharacterized membrane protein YfcA